MVHVTWGAFVLNVVFATVGRHFLKPVKPFVAERRKSAATKRCSWEGASPLSPWSIWVFPKIAVPQNGWFVMEHPIKMDDLGVPLFLETPISLENWSGYGEWLTFYYLGWSFKYRSSPSLVDSSFLERGHPSCHQSWAWQLELLSSLQFLYGKFLWQEAQNFTLKVHKSKLKSQRCKGATPLHWVEWYRWFLKIMDDPISRSPHTYTYN